ncbi:MAG: threonine aldolase family protein [Rhizobiaceae bacterium]
MYFASDNWAGAHPSIAQSLVTHASGYAPAYGTSDLDRRVETMFSEVFEREVSVFFVSTGTAANALAYSAVARPGGVMFAHREAHMVEDECGAPEFLSGGGRLCPVDGPLGRLDPKGLEAAIARYPAEFLHSGRPAGVTLTQATEIGTVYDLDEIGTIAGVCRRHKLPLHMDGARFANALVSLGCSPAEMTWKSGVDMVSFGGTKNGCWCAEALVIFDPHLAAEFPFIRKRAAQLFSKSRFVAAQFAAYFENGLWMEMAGHANAMAAKLASHIEASAHARLAWRPQANEVFPIVKREKLAALKKQGAFMHEWGVPAQLDEAIAEDEVLCRLVASFATQEDDVVAFAKALG